MKLLLLRQGPCYIPPRRHTPGAERRRQSGISWRSQESRLPTVAQDPHCQLHCRDAHHSLARSCQTHKESLCSEGQRGQPERWTKDQETRLRPSASSRSSKRRRPAEWSQLSWSAPYDMIDPLVPPSPTPEARKSIPEQQCSRKPRLAPRADFQPRIRIDNFSSIPGGSTTSTKGCTVAIQQPHAPKRLLQFYLQLYIFQLQGAVARPRRFQAIVETQPCFYNCATRPKWKAIQTVELTAPFKD